MSQRGLSIVQNSDNQLQDANVEPYIADMSDHPTREEMKAKIERSALQTEVKIAKMDGKLDLVLSKLGDIKEDNRATRSNQWVIGGTLALLIIAIATLFPAFFDAGSKIRDLVHNEVSQSLPRPPPPAPSGP